jgi:hypothetical protein
MWPFGSGKKSLKDLPSITSDDYSWGVAQADYDGSPLIVRFNSTAKEWQGHTDLPIKLGFAIPLNSPNEGGLPDPAENQQLNDIEDIVCKEVAERAQGLQVLALTMGTMKEIVFYIAPGADIKTIHESVQAKVKTHEVQCMAEMESNWDTYGSFVP